MTRIEHIEIYGVGHGEISGIVGVQVIAGIIRRQVSGRMFGVARDGIEIDYAVICFARTDPVVYGLALYLTFRSKGHTFEGCWSVAP